MVVIIPHNTANLGSVLFALQRLDADSMISTDINTIRKASKVIIPGVGAAIPAMKTYQYLQLTDAIATLTQPVLGICLGMQLLYERSTEDGDTPCLNIFPGTIAAMTAQPGIRIPHMGWNNLKIEKPSCPLLNGIEDQDYAYFVHSYYAPINQYTVATTKHGVNFSALVQKNNFFGCQFHPERSGFVGSQILENFLNL